MHDPINDHDANVATRARRPTTRSLLMLGSFVASLVASLTSGVARADGPPPPVAAPAPAPVAAPTPAPPPVDSMAGSTPVVGGTTSAPSTGGLQVTTLRVLREKGVLTQKEFDSITRDAADSTGALALDSNVVILGKWSTTLYGFVEADSIYDSTQSFNDLAGSSQVKSSSTYAGSNSRTQFGARNSRFGLRMSAPETHDIRASAQLEMDFLGDRSSIGDPSTGNNDSENQYFTNPLLRIRHMNLKIETPILNFLIGQYWDLFGWQSVYHPSSVQIQGLPGQIYSRTPQIRVWKSIEAGDVLLEIAAAAMRPVQRDSGMPEFQGGIRFAHKGWTGVTTAGSTATSVQPFSVAVTGDYRTISLLTSGSTSVSQSGYGVAVDAFIPVIPASKRQGNALSITAEFAFTQGGADLYTGLNGGLPFNGAIPAAMAGGAATNQLYLDKGIGILTASNGIDLANWQTMIFGLQYYFPGTDGKVWLTGNVSYAKATNIGTLMTDQPSQTKISGAGVRDHELFWDANLFADITDAVRLGLEFAQFKDSYVSTTPDSTNNRVQFSGFYLF